LLRQPFIKKAKKVSNLVRVIRDWKKWHALLQAKVQEEISPHNNIPILEGNIVQTENSSQNLVGWDLQTVTKIKPITTGGDLFALKCRICEQLIPIQEVESHSQLCSAEKKKIPIISSSNSSTNNNHDADSDHDQKLLKPNQRRQDTPLPNPSQITDKTDAATMFNEQGPLLLQIAPVEKKIPKEERRYSERPRLRSNQKTPLDHASTKKRRRRHSLKPKEKTREYSLSDDLLPAICQVQSSTKKEQLIVALEYLKEAINKIEGIQPGTTNKILLLCTTRAKPNLDQHIP